MNKVAQSSLEIELKLETPDDIVKCFETFVHVSANISEKQNLQCKQLQESKRKMVCLALRTKI